MLLIRKQLSICKCQRTAKRRRTLCLALPDQHDYDAPCLCVGWLVCQQDYTKTAEWISTWMEDGSDLGPQQIPLTFSAVPGHFFFFSTFFNVAK